MGKVVRAVVGIVGTVVGVVTGQWWLVAAGAALTMSSVMKVPKPTANAATEQRLSKKLEPEAFRKIVFGETAAGGDLRYWEVYGNDANEYDEVIAAATHVIEAYGRLYLNDELAIEAGANNGIGKFAPTEGGLLRQMSLAGIPGTNTVQGGMGAFWNTSTSFTGVAHYRLRFVYDPKKWPQGIPSRYTQVIKGAWVYDPRRDVRFGGTHVITDQSTWQYSPTDSNGKPIGRNNALQMLWYQLGWRINGKLVAGKGVDPRDIDIDSFIQAANDCEVMEWYSDCILSTGDSHDTNEGILEAAAGGNLLDTGGRFSYYVAVDDTANVAVELDSGDIIGEGFNWSPRQPMTSFYNEIAGTYIDPAALYQPRPFPLVYDNAYYAADGRKVRKTDALSAVQDPIQAQRLKRIELNLSRLQGEFNATFTYKAIRARNYSIVKLRIPEIGWTEPRLFRVISYGLSAMNGIDLTLREVHGSAYLGGTVVTPAPPSTGSGADPYIEILVGDEESVEGVPISTLGDEDSVIDGVNITYPMPPVITKRTELQYRKKEELAWVTLILPSDVNTHDILPLLPLTLYEFRIRHISIYDVPGPWYLLEVTTGGTTTTTVDRVVYPPTTSHPTPRTLREIIDGFDSLVDVTPPGVPTGLLLGSTSVPDAAGNPFVRVTAEWTGPSDSDLAGYDVEVTDGGFTAVYRVTTAYWSTVALTGRTYSIRVRSVDRTENASSWTTPQNVVGAGDSTPPGVATGLSVAASLGSLFLSWTNAADSDLSEVEVWENTVNNSGTAVRIDTVNALPGAAGSYTRSGLSTGNQRYFWLKSVDTSKNVSGFSAAAMGTVPSVPVTELDTTPPGVPTGLALTSNVRNDAAGNPVTRVVASWNANTEPDLGHYDLEITESGGLTTVRFAGTNSDEFIARAGVTYTARVRAADRVDNVSAWSSSVSTTATGDTTPPAAPTGLTSTPALGSIILVCTAPSASDTASIEFYENTINNSGTAYPVGRSVATPSSTVTWTRGGLGSGVTLYYWAKAYDASGNVSGFSSVTSTTTLKINVTDFASTLTPPELMTTTERLAATPTLGRLVFDKTDTKLYRGTGTQWTRATDGADITANSIIAGQLTAGAISTRELATDAITTIKIGANQITGVKIDAQTITTDKLAVTGALPVGLTIGTGSATLGDIDTRASDPAARINAGTTLVGPGFIRIQGTTSLNDWRDGTDIRGGSIKTNSVDATKLTIGNRQVDVGLIWTTNSPGSNQISWSAGHVAYQNDAGTITTASVSAGTATWSAGWLAIWFNRVSGSIVTGDMSTPAGDPNSILLATYRGGTNLTQVYGRTTIEGDYIRTDAIDARTIKAGEVQTTHLAALSITAPKIAADAITAEKIKAGEITGDKFNTGTSLPGTITVGVTGVSIGTIQSQANDPAARINTLNTTRITPGLIQISGSTNLSDWRQGGDDTRIAGGAISANTIAANKLKIGNRNISIVGCEFQWTGSALSWTSGYVLYENDAGTPVQTFVSGGSTTWSGGAYKYVYWPKDAGSFSVGVDNSGSIMASDGVIMCTWANGANFIANYGGTIVDGGKITTGSIQTAQLAALAITTDKLAAGAVTALKINVTSLSAINANLGNVYAGYLANAETNPTFALNLTAGEEAILIGTDGVQYRGANIGASGQAIGLWIGPRSVSRASASKSNAWFGYSASTTGGPLVFGSGMPTTTDPVIVLPNDYGYIVTGSGHNPVAGSSWQPISSAIITGVVPGQQISASGDLTSITIGNRLNGQVRLVEQGSGLVIAGPVIVNIVGGDVGTDSGYDMIGAATVGGSVTYTVEARQGGSDYYGGNTGTWAFTRFASATSSNPGYMSPTQAQQLETLWAGGGGGGGPPLATTAPPSVGTNTVGTGTSAARNDHTHAHGDQAGGTLHAAATTSVAGFMTPTQVTALNNAAQQGAAEIRAGASGVGYVRLVTGDSTHTGYVDFMNSAGVRQGYLGYASSNIIEFGADGSNVVNFNKRPAFNGYTPYDAANYTSIPVVTTSVAGLSSAADKTKLNGIATGATANSSDATLLARGNHTGSQSYTTITGLGSAATKSASTSASDGTLVERLTYSGTPGSGLFGDVLVSRGGSGAVFFGGASDYIFMNGSQFVATRGWSAPSFTPTSDIRFKYNLRNIPTGALQRVMRMAPTDFTRLQDNVDARGFIAQDLAWIDSKYVVTVGGGIDIDGNPTSGHLAIDPVAIIADLVGAIQELQKEVAILKKPAVESE